MNYTLTCDSPETPVFKIDKVCEVLLEGNTPCVLLRSIEDSEFHPITDFEGNEITYLGNPSGVVLNTSIRNTARACRFKFSLAKDLMFVDSSVQVTLSQGW